jgi:hypothetical protein
MEGGSLFPLLVKEDIDHILFLQVITGLAVPGKATLPNEPQEHNSTAVQ